MALSSDLYFNLRKDILQGKLRQGEKLTEQQICDEYSVSRTPVREAFRQLELEGFIDTIPNRGAFVTGFSSRDIEDMYELRKQYEILAVRWAIERITDEEYEKLQEAFEFMEFYTQKQDMEKMLKINMNFHDLIYKASKNRMLYHILSSYQLYIKQSKSAPHGGKSSGEVSGNDVSSGHLDEILSEHRAIFEAFKKRDPAAGMEAMSGHLNNAKRRGTYSE
ncbi:MAG TPA: GntR family transcriptional regulator [Anaerovoracaceae bacterium]|nr:GntR family transcriptional regulator [Anaerovoracaceae bacterium]